MTINTQILFGSIILILCSFIHILLLVAAIRTLRWEEIRTHHKHSLMASLRKVVIAFAFVLLAHTIQVWVWALSFVGLGTLSDMEDAIYFVLVTYTTVGYGDLTIGEGARIFGAMAAVTGLLNFGLSTAFLVGIFERVTNNKKHPSSGY